MPEVNPSDYMHISPYNGAAFGAIKRKSYLTQKNGNMNIQTWTYNIAYWTYTVSIG